MTLTERKLQIAHKKRELVESEARRDIHELCQDLSGRIGNLQESPDVIKELTALNKAMELYIEVLESAKDEYDEAVTEYADEKFNAKYA